MTDIQKPFFFILIKTADVTLSRTKHTDSGNLLIVGNVRLTQQVNQLFSLYVNEYNKMSVVRSDSTTTQKEKEMSLHIEGPESVKCASLSLSLLKKIPL